MESLTLNRTEVESDQGSRYPQDLLELRQCTKDNISLLQSFKNSDVNDRAGEKPTQKSQPKVLGEPPKKQNREERDRKGSEEKSGSSKQNSQGELVTLGRGSDPPLIVEGTFMDLPKPPVTNRAEAALRKKLRKYKEKKQKSLLSRNQQLSISRKIYAELAQQYPGGITWGCLWEYCRSHPEVAQSLNVAEAITEDVNVLCDKVGSRPDDTITVYDLDFLIYLSKTAKTHTAREVERKPIKEKPDHIVLADDVLHAIFDTFHKLDIHNEQIIIREDFITEVGELETANSNLEAIAFTLPEEKTLGEVLAAIEDDGNTEEDLTLAQLRNYFQYNYIPSNEQEEEEFNAIILENQDLRMLYNTFSKFVGEGDATNTERFVNAVLEGANFGELRKKTARKQSKKSKIKDETVEELLKRIKESAGETLTWNIFLVYLSPYGEPQNAEILTVTEEQESVALESVSSDSTSLNETTEEDKSKPPLTVPTPPSFLYRKSNYRGGIAERKKKEMIAAKEQEELKELNNKFRSQDVDKVILEEKYNQMEAEQQRVRQENRERRKQELIASTHPFAVAEKVPHRETPQPQAPTHFRASEVPETSRQLMWEELQQREELRKEKIKQKAEEKLKQAALPPRMETDLNKPKKSQMTAQQKHIFRACSLPDFSALHSKNLIQAQPQKVTECEPFVLTAMKNCHQPTEDQKLKKSVKESKSGQENGIKQQKIKQTVLNHMKSQSADQSRRETFQTEIDEVFTGEMSQRKESFKCDIESIFSSTSTSE